MRAPPARFALFPIVFSVFLGSLAAQTTWHLDDNAAADPGPGDPTRSDPGEDGSPAHPFDSISDALAVAGDGDVLVFEDGVYRGPGNRGLLVTRELTFRSLRGPENCTIDCEGADFGLRLTQGGPLTIRGLRIVNAEQALRVLTQGTFLLGCVFEGNHADEGGALWLENAFAHVENCVFKFNEAEGNGGAISIRLGSQPTILGCTFVDNVAGTGDGSGVGGAVYAADSSVTRIENGILWNNLPGQLALGPFTQGVTVTFSDVQGGLEGVTLEPGANLDWGEHNLALDPHFVDLEAGDTHLLPISPLLSRANTDSAQETTDFEGDPRWFGAGVDMGADEFHPHLWLTGDPRPGGFFVVNIVASPGTAPVGVAASLSILDTPLPTSLGLLHLGSPFLPGSPVFVGAIPPLGRHAFTAPIPPGTPPVRVGFQAFVAPALVNLAVLEVR